MSKHQPWLLAKKMASGKKDGFWQERWLLARKIGLGIGISDPNAYTLGDLLLEYNTVVGARKALSYGAGYGGGKGVTLQRNLLTPVGVLGSGEKAPHF